MVVQVACPHAACGAVGSVEEASLGRRGRCRKCGRSFDLARVGPGPAGGDEGAREAETGAAATRVRGDSAPPGSPAAGPPGLPEEFGRYRILRPLGRGGMGAVYLARDTALGRSVALKVPFLRAGDDGAQAVGRFLREARAAATLDHPNLCPVFDVGEVAGIPYLTMPFIDGRPLAEAMGRGRAVTPAQAAAVARKLALALHEAHARGVVHRDLKPGNVMINRRRELIIMDFGLARLAEGDDSSTTRTGHILGTALYMAPEQAAGDVAAIGPAADVYALGVILHELLTGVRPFEGPWSLVIGLKSVQDPAPPSTHRPDLPAELDAACLRALARRPGDRYPSMAEFAADLGGFLARPAAPAPAAFDAPPAPRPAEDTEALAAQVFAGLISREATSIRPDAGDANPRGDGAAPRRPARTWAAVAGAGALLVALLGVVVNVATDKGQVRIVLADPRAVVRVDGQQVAVEGLGKPITLRIGEHELTVKHGDDHFETRRFAVRRGKTEVARFEHRPKPAAGEPPAPDPAGPEVVVQLTPAPPAAPGVPDPAVPAPAVVPAPADVPPAPKAFVPLLADDGLAGLIRRRRNGREAIPWALEGGEMVARGPRGSFFCFPDDYRDFDLKAEVWRGDDNSSGCLVFRHGSNQGYSIGLGRAQGDAGDAASGASRAATGAISLWRLAPGSGNKVLRPGSPASPPKGRWFPVDLEVRGNHIRAQVAGGPWIEADDAGREHPTGQVGFMAMGGAEGSTLKIRRVEVRPVD